MWEQFCEENIVVRVMLYDHSGISVYLSTQKGPHMSMARWDSMAIGYYVMSREEARNELFMSYHRPTDDDVRRVAIHHMEQVIEDYNDFLSGNVYGYQILAELDTPAPTVGKDVRNGTPLRHVESCWGFRGAYTKSGASDWVTENMQAINEADKKEWEANAAYGAGI